MSKETSIIVLGVWVVIVPYLGVPASWRTVLLVLSGAAIATLGFLLRGEAMTSGPLPRKTRGGRVSSSFVEHIPPVAEESPESAKEGINSLN
ncbi:MAG: hypothetical protein Q7S26_03275 [bacterium]|nr:hypothetical protein [bacterium]